MTMSRCYGCGVDGAPVRPLLRLAVDDRDATVCNACWLRLDPDVWVSREAWEEIDPATRYDDLPMG